MTFKLDERLDRDTVYLGDFSLCQVRLMNDRQYPWIILVPRRDQVAELYELSTQDQHQLIDEIAQASRALNTLHMPDKLNVGALGNVVKQLHIHIVGRFSTDRSWPGPVWGVHPPEPYHQSEQSELVNRFTELLFN